MVRSNDCIIIGQLSLDGMNY